MPSRTTTNLPIPTADLSSMLAMPSTEQTLRSVLRFLSVVRRRKGIMIITLLVSGILGAIYYQKATPIYQASSSLLVQHNIPEHRTKTSGPSQTALNTYSELFTSDAVLLGAVKRLEKAPPKIFQGTTSEHWPVLLQALVDTSTRSGTNIIEVGCNSPDPESCVQVINAVVDSSLEFLDKNQKNLSLELVKSLDSERRDLEQRLLAKERDYLNAKRQCGDISADDNSTSLHPLIQRAVHLNESLLEAQQTRIEQESLLAAIQLTVQDDGDLIQHLKSLEAILGERFVRNALGLNSNEADSIPDVQQQLRDHEVELATLSRHYGPAHPQYAQAQEKITRTRRYLDNVYARIYEGVHDGRVGGRLLGMVEASLANASQHEQTIKAQYALAEKEALALNDRLADLAMAEREVTMLRNLHDVLLERIADIDINLDRALVRVSVISDPVLPGAPIHPRLSRIALMCLIIGLAISIGIIYSLDLLDDRFQSPEEMQNQMGATVMAMVRELPSSSTNGIDALHTYHSPTSVESEAFRTLRTTLAFSASDTSCLAVTSSEPSDGKTTVLSNLGASFAQANKRTLLIDADMRKPGLSKLFSMRGQRGLSEILRSDENIAQMATERIQGVGVDKLDLLPCGPKPIDPSELLSGPRMEDMLGWAASHYDQVLVDCPPILAASDAAVLGRLTEGIMLVIQPEKNHRRVVLRAVEDLRSLGVNLIGIVANRISSEKGGGYYGYGYGAGYGYGYGYGYGTGYGEEEEDNAQESETQANENPGQSYPPQAA